MLLATAPPRIQILLPHYHTHSDSMAFIETPSLARDCPSAVNRNSSYFLLYINGNPPLMELSDIVKAGTVSYRAAIVLLTGTTGTLKTKSGIIIMKTIIL